MSRIAVLLADGFEEIEAITSIDLLRRAGIRVDVLGILDESVTGSHGIEVKADTRINAYRPVPDGVLVPGGMPGAQHLADSSATAYLITTVAEASGLVAAICAAPAVVLAPLGLLAGKRATCYPGFEERFDDDVIFVEDRVVLDGNILTSRGPGTAAAFACEVIRYFLGDESAEEIRTGTLQPY
jgi:protein deglycase